MTDTWGCHVFTSPDRSPGHFAQSRYPKAKAAHTTKRRLDFGSTPPPSPHHHTLPSPRRPATTLGRPLGKFGDGYAIYPACGGHKFLVRPFDPMNLTALGPKLRPEKGSPNPESGSDADYYKWLSHQISTGRRPPGFHDRPRAASARATSRHAMDQVPGLWPHQHDHSQANTAARMNGHTWKAHGTAPPWGHIKQGAGWPVRAGAATYYPASAPQCLGMSMSRSPASTGGQPRVQSLAGQFG